MKNIDYELSIKIIIFIFWVYCLINITLSNTIIDVIKYSIVVIIISFEFLFYKNKGG